MRAHLGNVCSTPTKYGKRVFSKIKIAGESSKQSSARRSPMFCVSVNIMRNVLNRRITVLRYVTKREREREREGYEIRGHATCFPQLSAEIVRITINP